MWNQEALGTIALNMAEKAPVKPLPPSVNSEQYLCRCCNFSFTNNPVDLFGPKSQSENLLSIVTNVTGVSVCESDCLPGKICSNFLSLRTCARSLELNKKAHFIGRREGRRWKKVLLQKNNEGESANQKQIELSETKYSNEVFRYQSSKRNATGVSRRWQG